MDEALAGFKVLDLDPDAAYRAGQAFARFRPGKQDPKLILPDFFIRAQAAVLGLAHLTNDRRGVSLFPDVDFLFPVR